MINKLNEQIVLELTNKPINIVLYRVRVTPMRFLAIIFNIPQTKEKNSMQ